MRYLIPAALLLTFGASAASAQAPELKWGSAPAVFTPGAQMAVLQGNPAAAGEYTVRLRMPSGYKIAPHWHPTDENITVISGTLKVGMGKTFDEKNMMSIPAGGFATAVAKQPHYA